MGASSVPHRTECAVAGERLQRHHLKRPALALAVTAGLLAAAGPASAGTTTEPKGGPPTNATASIIVYDFEGEAVHQVPQGIGIDVGVVELNAMGGDDSVDVWAPGDGSDF